MSHLFFRPFFALIFLLGNLNGIDILPPSNDNWANAEELPPLPFLITADASGATLETNEYASCLNSERTIWYTFTAPETTTLYVDGGESNISNIFIYRAAGPGIENLEFVHVHCGGWDTDTFDVEAGETYYVQVAPYPDYPGIVPFRMGETTPLTGRVIDEATGEPPTEESFTQILLYRECGPECQDWVSTQLPDSEGRFQFDIYPAVDGQPDTYVITILAHLYHEEEFGPFKPGGVPLDVGDLGIDRFASINSIQGRVLDKATGKPIPAQFTPVVHLHRCTVDFCYEEVASQAPDSQGRFRFERDTQGNSLTTNVHYQITFSGNQYQQAQTQLFEVSAGADHTIGSLRVQSFPVRFSDVIPCPDVTASSGECSFSVRIWNGLGTDLSGEVWNIMNAYMPNSPSSVIGASEFQLKEPRHLEVPRGKSKVFGFHVQIPVEHVPHESTFCTSIYVGRGKNPSFDTLGSEYFCFRRIGDDLTLLLPQDTQSPIPAHKMIPRMEKDLEPNNSCQTPQDVGGISETFQVQGMLDSLFDPDIDFYRFSGIAGDPFQITLEGQATGAGTLPVPLLGAFNSDCELIDSSSDAWSGISRLVLRVPEDGVFILAATEAFDFYFLGGGNGSYRLTVSPLGSIISITGTLTDARTGMPIPGYVWLLRCGENDCFDAVSVKSTDGGGRFRFESDFNGLPLTPGTYVVSAGAYQYQYADSPPFTVGEAEEIDIGNVALPPWTIQMSDAQGCDIPMEGGVCEFSVKVMNTLSTKFVGKAWSMIYATSTGSFLNYSTFQTQTAVNLRLDAAESRTLHFRLRIPGAVADGASICPVVYAGQNPDPYFNMVGQIYLFCMTKGPNGLTLMSPEETQAVFETMKTQRLRPNLLLTDKE
jgi:hypothetical protein